MEVNFAKVHSEKHECGLCEFEANTLDDLETHQFTCEIYIYRFCTLRFKKLSDVKAHIEKDHTDNRWNSVEHVKQEREIST